MNHLFLAILLFLSLVRGIPLWCQIPVHFVSESIDFRYESGLFHVNGIYQFTSGSRGSYIINISYPLPCGTADLDTIYLFNMNHGNPMTFEQTDSSIRFAIEVSPDDTLCINTVYKQRIQSDTLRYILTSTGRWGEPLKRAVYRFEAPGFKGTPQFSYPPDREITKGTRRIWIWEKTDFMPDQDFMIILK